MDKTVKKSQTISDNANNQSLLAAKIDIILSGLQQLSNDYANNLHVLTTLCGELLNAKYSLYKRLVDGTLLNVCKWNAPDGFKYSAKLQDTISYDVIQNHATEFCLIKDLQQTKYADSVAVINRIGLKTYMGHKIYYDKQCRGIICNLYDVDYEPSLFEKKILQFIAALIGIEESRAAAAESSANSEENYKQLYTLLRLICDNEPDMIWAKNTKNEYLFANKAFCEGLLDAVDTAEPVGKTDMFFAERARNNHLENPEWHTFGEICRDTDQITLDAMVPSQFDEFGNVRGKFLRLDVHKAPLIDDNGNLIGTVGSARDVTQNKAIEQALISSQERYKALLDANPDLMFLVSNEGIILDYKADNAVNLYTKPEEFLNKHVSTVLPVHIADLVMQMIHDVQLSSLVQRSEYNINSHGTEKYFECRMAACGADQFLAIVRDITDSKKSADSIRESEARFRMVVETSNEGIWMMDKNCATTYVNQKMLEMLGCDNSDMIGFPVEKWMFEDDLTAHNEKMQERKKGNKDTYERRFRSKDGREVWTMVSATAIQDESGNFNGSFGMFTDITERKLTEKALVDSEERYRLLLEYAPVSIAVHLDGKVVFVNPAAIRLMGANSAEQLIGKPIMEFVHPAFRDIAKSNLTRLAKGETRIYPAEYMFTRLDGSFVPVEVYANLLRYHNKPAVQIMISDTSERKIAESRILRNEASLKSIINILQHRSETLHDFLNYALSEAIKLTESIYGYIFYYSEDKQEFEVFTWSQNAYEDSKIKDYQTANKLENTGIWGEVVRQRKPIMVNDYQAPHPLKKGQPHGHVLLTRFMAIPIFSDGKIVATLGVANKKNDYDETDVLQLTLLLDSVWKVVERKTQEDELRKLSRAVEQSPVSIIITDTKGKIEYVNDFFSQTTGYALDEVRGKSPSMLKSGETTLETYQVLWENISTGVTWTGEFHNKKKNGELYWEEASISPVINPEGKITHFIAVKEDITKRKQITQELIDAKEEAEQMNHLKSTFLANMSHELRTPLVGILGFSELLPSVMDNQEAIDMAKTIYSSGRRLLNTLNLILDLSRIEANKQEIKWQTIEINQFIRSIIKLFDAVAVQKGISLKFMSKIEPLYLFTDRSLLEHVINDLVNNAIKYTNIGSVMVRLKIEPNDKANYVQIKVIDTGIGIPKEQQAVIFDAFRQASEGYERSYEGTGLGLTISHRYVQLLDGHITVSSEPGLGSEFTISFPEKLFKNDIAAVSENENSGLDINGTLAKVTPHLPRILLIDDDEISHMLTSRMLAGVAEVDYASSGDQALELAAQTAYPLILLDIHLRKGISGLDVLSDIKKLESYAHTPVVAVTAYSMLGDKETFISQGCTHYLSKPYSKDELVMLVQEILK